MTTSMSGPREWAGRLVGVSWALPVALISHARRARMFHPRGSLFHARVRPDPDTPWVGAARRLSGDALLRLSGALFKPEVRRFEVLGAALRISSAPIGDAEPRAGDQDLLFATIRSPLTMPFSPLSTRSDDYLANHYYGVAPFFVAGVGRLKLRLRPLHVRRERRAGRAEAIAEDVRTGEATFALEGRPTLRRGWEPLACIDVDAPAAIDQEALRFDPFRDGRGVTPVGFVHAIRKAVYAASQAARPRDDAERRGAERAG
jgi:hypothetical protein